MDVCVSVWVYAFMWVQCHRKPEEGTRFPGARVRAYLRDPHDRVETLYSRGISLIPFSLFLCLYFSYVFQKCCYSLMEIITITFSSLTVSYFLFYSKWVHICEYFFNWETGLLKLWWRCIFFCLFILSLVCLFVWDSVSSPATCQYPWNATQHWKQKVDWTVNSMIPLLGDHHPCWRGILSATAV